MSIGSWPRPRWMVQAVHERLEGRLDEASFQATADDAVRLAVAAQLRARVDVVTDGEQRRDSYASFVGAILDNCQLIPLTDLLPLVEDPEEFARDCARSTCLRARSDIRRFRAAGAVASLAVHEATFRGRHGQADQDRAAGSYLLTRTMWMDCIVDRAYASREHLAQDIVRVLREEVAELLAAGVSIVQLDEPVLSEVVFSGEAGAHASVHVRSAVR